MSFPDNLSEPAPNAECGSTVGHSFTHGTEATGALRWQEADGQPCDGDVLGDRRHGVCPCRRGLRRRPPGHIHSPYERRAAPARSNDQDDAHDLPQEGAGA